MSEVVFVEPGVPLGLQEMADGDFVVGVHPDGTGVVLKDRQGPRTSAEFLSAACVEWLRANPTNRPEDFQP